MADVDEFLAHHGVKGMKWGKRKADSESSEPRKTRKEVREINRKGRADFDEKKLSTIINEALKGDVLVQTLGYGDTYPTVVTGKEFVDYASRGGLLNPRMTEVYARNTGSGYEINANPIGQYKKVKR